MDASEGKALPLGAQCTYSARLTRREYSRGRKRWDLIDLGTAIPAVYIGWRTLSEGTNDYDSEEGYIYTPTHHFDAALVVYDARCKPVFVPFDALEARP